MKRKHLFWITLINTFTLTIALIILIVWFNIFGDITTAFTRNTHISEDEKRILQEQYQRNVSPSIVKKQHIPIYEVDLHFDPKTFNLTGTSRIYAWNNAEQATKELNVQLFLSAFNEGRNLPILPEHRSKSYPNGPAYGKFQLFDASVKDQKVTYKESGTILNIQLQREWKPKQKIIVELKWSARIPEIYHRIGMKDDAFWFGNALPVLAVYDNRWHVNDYEAVGDPFFTETSNYKVKLETPSQYTVVASGNQKESVYNGVKQTLIEATEIREFAFAISSNHKVKSSTSKSGKQVNLHYRYIKDYQANEALKTAVQMLNFMEQRVGEYPYQKLDVFENEMFLSGMEYPGLVFIGYSKFNYPSIAHEVAHQWFYNLIGNDQINEPWLDEGLVTYFTDEYLKGNSLKQFFANEQSALSNNEIKIMDTHGYTKWSSYWSGVYRKGSLMYYNLRKEMGDQAFSNFIRGYVQKYKYQIITQDEFIKYAQSFTDKDLNAFFMKWISK